jgi:hypothetical protein
LARSRFTLRLIGMMEARRSTKRKYFRYQLP